MNSRTSIALIALSLVAGSAAAQSTQAVEWKVSEGGNGHWYGFIETLPPASWIEAKTICESRGGYLATVPTSQENAFVMNFLAGREVYLGGYQPEGSCEPLCNWTWISGEPWIYSTWNYLEPNNAGAEQDFLRSTTDGSWDDIENRHPSQIFQIAIEWSADCNNDGIVDYGQIKSGQLADDNANGIPDICETSVTGVIPPSVPSQGGSTIIINGRNFPAQTTVLVGGTAATNVVRVSDTRLTATAPAGLPGMRSITVNGFTLTDGIYYRPECGSDLDQDGEVTAADIAIVLLDFGPCYVTATSPQADDSKPFILQEQPAPEAPRSR